MLPGTNEKCKHCKEPTDINREDYHGLKFEIRVETDLPKKSSIEVLIKTDGEK